MPDDARTVPPGQGRIAAATRSGLLKRSEILAAGLTLLACSGAMALTGKDSQRHILELVEDGVVGSVVTGMDPISALKNAFYHGFIILAPILLAALFSGFVSTKT